MSIVKVDFTRFNQTEKIVKAYLDGWKGGARRGLIVGFVCGVLITTIIETVYVVLFR